MHTLWCVSYLNVSFVITDKHEALLKEISSAKAQINVTKVNIATMTDEQNGRELKKELKEERRELKEELKEERRELRELKEKLNGLLNGMIIWVSIDEAEPLMKLGMQSDRSVYYFLRVDCDVPNLSKVSVIA